MNKHHCVFSKGKNIIPVGGHAGGQHYVYLRLASSVHLVLGRSNLVRHTVQLSHRLHFTFHSETESKGYGYYLDPLRKPNNCKYTWLLHKVSIFFYSPLQRDGKLSISRPKWILNHSCFWIRASGNGNILWHSHSGVTTLRGLSHRSCPCYSKCALPSSSNKPFRILLGR